MQYCTGTILTPGLHCSSLDSLPSYLQMGLHCSVGQNQVDGDHCEVAYVYIITCGLSSFLASVAALGILKYGSANL